MSSATNRRRTVYVCTLTHSMCGSELELLCGKSHEKVYHSIAGTSTRKLLEQNGAISGLVNFKKKCWGTYTNIARWLAVPCLHRYYYRQRFYCAKLLQIAVYAIVILSVCPFVCLSVTHWCTALNLINVGLSWKSRFFSICHSWCWRQDNDCSSICAQVS